MRAAFDELAALGAAFGQGAVQLTPGNHPTPGFQRHVAGAAAASRSRTRTHHGFDFEARKREVWSSDGRCLVDADSVHPPTSDSAAARAVEARGGVGAWLETHAFGAHPLLETMYPGYLLGTGDELEDAMRLGAPLAVDVSHVFIQLCAGAMKETTWQRLAAYEHVREVHVSANAGTHDSHAPLTPDSFGLGWARERLRAGVPTVLECYVHRLSPPERAGQMELLLGGT